MTLVNVALGFWDDGITGIVAPRGCPLGCIPRVNRTIAQVFPNLKGYQKGTYN